MAAKDSQKLRKELDDIFASTTPNDSCKVRERTREEVLGVIGRRLDSVGRNAESLTKHVGTLEEKIAKVDNLLGTEVGGAEGEDGDETLPFVEVVEELDENDNVISFKLQRPDEAALQIVETLKKVGVDMPDETGMKEVVKEQEAAKEAGKGKLLVSTAVRPESPEAISAQPATMKIQDETAPSATTASTTSKRRKPVEPTNPIPPKPLEPRRPSQPLRQQVSDEEVRRSVGFASDTKPGHDIPPAKGPFSTAAQRIENMMKTAKEQEAISRKRAVLPADESEEDAALRREMLEYSMGEVGAVVAELEIEENDASSSSDDKYLDEYVDDDDYGDDDYDDEEDADDDDQYGRSTGRHIPDGYLRRMRQLQKKWGTKAQQTLSAEQSAEVEDGGAPDKAKEEGIGRIVVKSGNQEQEDLPSILSTEPTRQLGKQSKGQRSVKFASSLDIAFDTAVSGQMAPKSSEREPKAPISLVDPLGDIVERSSHPTRQTPNPARKASRFKQGGQVPNFDPTFDPPPGPLDAPAHLLDKSRAMQDGTTPTPIPAGPEGKTLGDVIEKEPPAPPDVDLDYDDTTKEEVAAQYHLLRNKFIQREGGFLKEDTSAVQPLTEEEGGPQRISRFKAARLSKQ